MVEYINCAICGSNSYRTINTCRIEKEDARIQEKILNIVKCNICGLIFVNPQSRFLKEDMKNLYNKEYFDKGYMRFNEPFVFRMDFIEKYKRPGRILDIGCATGELLDLARNRGWEAFGVEVSEYAADSVIKKHGLNIFKGTLEEARYPDNYFDAVCAGDILEHLGEPHNFLREIRRILKTKGLLYLSFPNADSFYYKFFAFICRFNHKNYFLLPYHTYHFGRSTIELLLDKTGFEMAELRFSHSYNPVFFMNIFNFRDRIVLIARSRA